MKLTCELKSKLSKKVGEYINNENTSVEQGATFDPQHWDKFQSLRQNDKSNLN